MTSCSEDSDLTMNESTNQTTNTLEIDPETGEERAVEAEASIDDILADADNQHIDLEKIIADYEAKTTKGDEKSIKTRIHSEVLFIPRGRYLTLKHPTSKMGSCYYKYRVQLIPYYGDPDVYIYGYDHSRYNRWRHVKNATRYLGNYGEETWYNRCDFTHYEEKCLIKIKADKGWNTKFKIIIDRFS